MASAKRLTTAELGAARYEKAEKSGQWPVEVRLPHHLDGGKHKLHVPKRSPISFQQDVHGTWRAFLSVPVGPLTYEIRRGDDLVSTGGLTVRAPDAPMTREKLAAGLASKPPSGAKQLEKNESDEEEGWPVEFRYEEETWSAKEVVVVSDALEEEISLTRGSDGAFKGEKRLSTGEFEYRFCIVPREAMRTDHAPFTRLGWDDAASKPQRLMTWPMNIKVERKETVNKRQEGANGDNNEQEGANGDKNEQEGAKGDKNKQEGANEDKNEQAGANENKNEQAVDGDAEGGGTSTYKSIDKSSDEVGKGGWSGGASGSTAGVQSQQVKEKGQSNNESGLWGAAVAFATLACAFGASMAFYVMNRKEGAETQGPMISIEEDNVEVGDKEVESVLRHAHSHSM